MTNAIDEALMAPFANDLEGLSLKQVNDAIREAEDQLAEIEPWLEALTAKKRQMTAPSAGDLARAYSS
jgi:hypothetical protein